MLSALWKDYLRSNQIPVLLRPFKRLLTNPMGLNYLRARISYGDRESEIVCSQKFVFNLEFSSWTAVGKFFGKAKVISAMSADSDPCFVPWLPACDFQYFLVLYCIHTKKLSCLKSAVAFDMNDILYEFKNYITFSLPCSTKSKLGEM